VKSPQRAGIQVVSVPANRIAAELGSNQLANMVMLGAVIEATQAVTLEQAVAALHEYLSEKKSHLIGGNEAALRRGMQL
jgi:2-oxoglutarate ferredoxin oxidoreductase subunit gamma